MQTENIFIAHPTTVDQINALKAVVKAFNVKFEIKKEAVTAFNSRIFLILSPTIMPYIQVKIRRQRQSF